MSYRTGDQKILDPLELFISQVDQAPLGTVNMTLRDGVTTRVCMEI